MQDIHKWMSKLKFYNNNWFTYNTASNNASMNANQNMISIANQNRQLAIFLYTCLLNIKPAT